MSELGGGREPWPRKLHGGVGYRRSYRDTRIHPVLSSPPATLRAGADWVSRVSRRLGGVTGNDVTETQYWDPSGLLAEGSVLSDRYLLGRLLGRGGMGEVYLAQDMVLNRQVAVKVFHSADTSLGDGKRRQLEAELLAGLSHPGLVTVFDAGFDAAEHLGFLVMEFVAGPTLAARLAGGPLLEGQVRQVAAAVTEALAYVHEMEWCTGT
jgi:serine/threonine protein kinase